MKTILACAAMAVTGVALADVATSYENLNLKDAASFSATVSDSTATAATVTGGTLNDGVTVDGGYMVADGDYEAASISLAQTSAAVKPIQKFEIVFKVTFADADSLPKVDDAKTGFAFTAASSAYYYDGSKWTAVTVPAGTSLSVEENDEVDLVIEYDARDTDKKVRFSLKGDSTTTAISDWLTVGAIATNAIEIYGAGSVKSIAGNTYTIESEVIDLSGEGESVTIVEEAVAAFNAQLTGDESLSTWLQNKNETTGASNLDSYTLGLMTVDSNGEISSQKLLVTGTAQETEAGKITLAPNVSATAANASKVSYTLKGSNDKTDWKDCSGMTIDLSGTIYKYYKITATIDYTK